MASPHGHHSHHHGREEEPHRGTGMAHVSHESHSTSHHHGSSNKPTYKVYCRAETNHCLSIRNGEVILARANPSDQHQHWYKEEEFSTRVKDAEGLPSFALVNKATGQAIKHATGNTKPVRLTEYKANHLDESILWTESKDTGESYKAIRMANNISLNFDAFHGDKDHGGVHDGTTVVNWEWTKGDNQRWKIVPY
ncbi:ricin B-like lectin R40C1 [Ipomoea triloba]|uniref:ricin B-like lectin R40C1 n=1 Tax=Ipomoea triloba TaxID=35885 RepID=UPI00125D0F7D|nr:ricin B-like lectin R40C1 [Ipomoea triloba]